MQTFTVTAQRGKGNVWVLECSELGAVSQVKRLDQADDEMREALSYLSGLSEDEFHINIVPELPEEISSLSAEAIRLQQEVQHSQAAMSRAQREAVSAMKRSGFTVRDMGKVLRVSYQRAAQISASL